MSGVDLVEPAFGLDDVLGMPLDIRYDPLKSARRVMHQDAALGSAIRCPGAPAISRNDPMEYAVPTHTVATGHLIHCMVS